jgi:4-aminobutyrate aminotransferase-like enzyme/Ser/Thr protein kinase RdoA (MazF antagonist)
VVAEHLSPDRPGADDPFVTMCETLLRERWGLRARLQDLGSMQDRVLRVDVDGAPAGVLKVSSEHRTEASAAAEADHSCQEHLQGRLDGLSLPSLVPALDGRTLQTQDGVVARLMTWVPGVPMARALHQTPDALEALGTTAGRMSGALAGFDHPALRRAMEWDPRRALQTLHGYLPGTGGAPGPLLHRAADMLAAALGDPALLDLPQQAVHLDVTDQNVFGWFTPTGSFSPSGIVDFGDMTWSWRISELASAVHAAIGWHCDDPLAALEPVVRGFHTQAPLDDLEADCLWTVILARAAVCAAIEHVEAAGPDAGDYSRHLAALDLTVLSTVLAVPAVLAGNVIRQACGKTVAAAPPIGDVLSRAAEPIVDPAASQVCGQWLELIDLPDDAADGPDPDALRLGVDIETTAGALVRSPLAGRVVAQDGNAVQLRFEVAGMPVFVVVDGLEPSVPEDTEVARREVIGTVPATRPDLYTGRIGVRVSTAPGLPAAGKVRHRSCWAGVSLDPSVLIGHPVREPESFVMDRARRDRHVAAAQPLYYRSPREIVRAEGVWMYDDTGRRYLDMVNNVAVLGHSHPRVTEAAARQFRELNTNSRFLYRAISEYAERIASLVPAELSSIFFTNSGSEAVDLALQLSRRFTGRRDVVVLEGAYHGWTSEVFELCTVPGDRPNWRDELAPYVHVAPAPDTFRGGVGADVSSLVAAVEQACADAARGDGVAAFVSEPILGSHGGIVPPQGYLAGAYAAVRRHGGVCIADEVQVGFARTGETFWAFESHGVVPDILAAAKAAGNGHPVGFVACRPEIAEAFARSSSYFSTPAGSPVSCRIGTTVIDVIRDEDLQHNALEVGAFINAGLRELALRHPVIGTIHGRGLYQGIDLVAAAGSTEPLATEQVSAICERLRELGCIVAPTGPHGNVLKVKPPLCLSQAQADRFLSALDHVLQERTRYLELSKETA